MSTESSWFIKGALLATVVIVTCVLVGLFIGGCATVQIDAGCDQYCRDKLPQWGGYPRGTRTPDDVCHCEPVGVPL